MSKVSFLAASVVLARYDVAEAYAEPPDLEALANCCCASLASSSREALAFFAALLFADARYFLQTG